jgi:hypothetical protein
MRVQVKNTFIEAKPPEDLSNASNPWRRAVTEPDTGGTDAARIRVTCDKGAYPEHTGSSYSQKKSTQNGSDSRTETSEESQEKYKDFDDKEDCYDHMDRDTATPDPECRAHQEALKQAVEEGKEALKEAVEEGKERTCVKLALSEELAFDEDNSWQRQITGDSDDNAIGGGDQANRHWQTHLAAYAASAAISQMYHHHIHHHHHHPMIPPSPGLSVPMPPYATYPPVPVASQQEPPARQTSSDAAEDDADIGEWKATTMTVMIKNLHNQVTQQMALDDFKAHGFDGTFDFFYMPIDAFTSVNKGYAFVNFVNAGVAKLFKQTYDDGQIGDNRSSKSGKFLKVTAATLQGFAANYAHYSSRRVVRGHPETRPLFYRLPGRNEQAEVAGLKAKQVEAGRVNTKRKPGQCRSLIDQAVKEIKTPEVMTVMGNVVQSGIPQHMQDPNVPLDRYCHQCGGKAASSFKYCMFCGSSIARENAQVRDRLACLATGLSQASQ